MRYKAARGSRPDMHFWSMIQGKCASPAVLTERVKELRGLYEKAKVDPQILKPLRLSIPELQEALIRNIRWIKAGGMNYAVHDADATVTTKALDYHDLNASRNSKQGARAN